MYYNNTAGMLNNDSNPYTDNKSIQSFESKQIGTGQFGDIKIQRSERNLLFRPQTQIVASKSSDNLMRRSNKKNRNQFYHNMRYTEEDFKADNDEDGYDSFLRKFKIDGERRESTTQHETFNANQMSSYTNYVEQKKLENNLSFSNNDIEPIENSDSFESGNNIHNLDEIDLNYDELARREQDTDEYNLDLSQDQSIVEDRVRQIPYEQLKHIEKPKPSNEVKIINENKNLDDKIQLVEEEIKNISEQYLEKKNNIPRTRRNSQGRNDTLESSHGSLSVSKTYRESKVESQKELTFFEPDLNSKSLIDIRTHSKHPRVRNSERKDISIERKRPQSSKTKRQVINHNNLHKPAAEGEIMMRVSVAITEDATYTVNVYKNDTAYAVADRCISQHLNKMKESLTIKPKVAIALKKRLAKYIQEQVNSSITHLKDEIEKDEARVFKENMKKLEQKKKDKLDKQKPFDLNTERRNKEKEEKDIKNPVIGSIKILVNPGKDGILYIREGADPNKLATSFINSYSLKKEQKESIVLEINRIIEQYKMKQLRKINESNNNLGNRSMLNEIKFITEGSNSTNEMNYFNIPQSKNEYIDRFKMPINYAVASSNDVENEDPNEHLMSPYFRGNLAENVPRFNQMKDNSYYEDIERQSKNSNNSNEKIQFIGFSPESTENIQRRESVASSAKGSQKDTNEYHRNENSKRTDLKRSIATITLDIGNGLKKKINIREGDNPYTLASNVVNEHGLDRSIVHDLRNRIAKVYTDNI